MTANPRKRAIWDAQLLKRAFPRADGPLGPRRDDDAVPGAEGDRRISQYEMLRFAQHDKKTTKCRVGTAHRHSQGNIVAHDAHPMP